mmetsp:Transcript_76120/g.174363  ORF Transcript_76120/g.174363 Transcript_76120/m.174363 type:complete len:482 (+) Transcript_76120:68-1513(+)
MASLVERGACRIQRWWRSDALVTRRYLQVQVRKTRFLLACIVMIQRWWRSCLAPRTPVPAAAFQRPMSPWVASPPSIAAYTVVEAVWLGFKTRRALATKEVQQQVTMLRDVEALVADAEAQGDPSSAWMERLGAELARSRRAVGASVHGIVSSRAGWLRKPRIAVRPVQRDAPIAGQPFNPPARHIDESSLVSSSQYHLVHHTPVQAGAVPLIPEDSPKNTRGGATFLRRRTDRVKARKVDWSKVGSRVDCWGGKAEEAAPKEKAVRPVNAAPRPLTTKKENPSPVARGRTVGHSSSSASLHSQRKGEARPPRSPVQRRAARSQERTASSARPTKPGSAVVRSPSDTSLQSRRSGGQRQEESGAPRTRAGEASPPASEPRRSHIWRRPEGADDLEDLPLTPRSREVLSSSVLPGLERFFRRLHGDEVATDPLEYFRNRPSDPVVPQLSPESPFLQDFVRHPGRYAELVQELRDEYQQLCDG